MKFRPLALALTFATIGIANSTPAYAVDGCKLLLCLAGPWGSIAECVGTVQQALRDLARGRAFPTCDMGGSDNTAQNVWNNQGTCPPWYRNYNDYNGNYVSCTYPGKIDVKVNGQLWTTVNWDMSGNTSTWYSDAARTALSGSQLDPKYDQDKAKWEAEQQPPPAPGPGDFGG
jgi:hypothetical protein